MTKTIEPAEVLKVIKGLLAIAEIAMPDSYFETDRRIKAAKKLVNKLNQEKPGKIKR